MAVTNIMFQIVLQKSQPCFWLLAAGSWIGQEAIRLGSWEALKR